MKLTQTEFSTIRSLITEKRGQTTTEDWKGLFVLLTKLDQMEPEIVLEANQEEQNI